MLGQAEARGRHLRLRRADLHLGWLLLLYRVCVRARRCGCAQALAGWLAYLSCVDFREGS